jgi:hypothetical protein
MQRRQFRQPPKFLSKIGARYWSAASLPLRTPHRAGEMVLAVHNRDARFYLSRPFTDLLSSPSPRSKLPMSLHIVAARAINGLESWFALPDMKRSSRKR